MAVKPTSEIPTGRTYLWFSLKWNLIFVATFLACLVLFKAGYLIVGSLVVLAVLVLLIRDYAKLVRRIKLSRRRPQSSPHGSSVSDQKP
jgi:hypothetical protein